MLSLQMLEADDRIQPWDWCRPLHLHTMSPQGDGYSFRSCYGGGPENNLKWCLVQDVLGPVWRGAKVRDITRVTHMEFVRGNIPKQHRLNMKSFHSLAHLWEHPHGR